MAKAHRTTKKIVEGGQATAAEPTVDEGNLQEALEETFPASDSISPYIRPAKSKEGK
jgi:hypothetical protein